MAMVATTIMTILTAGFVVSQNTIDDNESPLDVMLQLAQLQQQQQQLAQVLSVMLDRQQQQLSKLNELQATLDNRRGKLGGPF